MKLVSGYPIVVRAGTYVLYCKHDMSDHVDGSIRIVRIVRIHGGISPDHTSAP